MNLYKLNMIFFARKQIAVSLKFSGPPVLFVRVGNADIL